MTQADFEKIKEANQRLQEVENEQILADVKLLNEYMAYIENYAAELESRLKGIKANLTNLVNII